MFPKTIVIILFQLLWMGPFSSASTAEEAWDDPTPQIHFLMPEENRFLTLAHASHGSESPVSSETPAKPERAPANQNIYATPWSVMYYHGVGTSNDLGQTLAFDIDWEDSQFTGLVFNRVMFPFWRYFTFELEGQVLKHFEKQKNWEYNGLFLIRFHPFILDEYIDIDFAAGEGISYASSIPVIEEEQHPNDTSHLLNYIVFEIAFTLPQYRSWTVVTRIHHRSGVFGSFNGAHGGSNFFATGLRYHF